MIESIRKHDKGCTKGNIGIMKIKVQKPYILSRIETKIKNSTLTYVKKSLNIQIYDSEWRLIYAYSI